MIMTGNDQVIAQLNTLLAGELSAIDQYFIHSRMYENWGFRILYERIAHEVQMLKDTEDDHTHWLEQQLGMIERIGLQNYLQAQI
jgi:bacterioferritin (cytochrome b1)